MSSQKIIVILGPTASGKSELAVKMALRLGSGQAKKEFGINGAEIISTDSRQIYKGLDIGSGKITKKERRGVPHYLLDVTNPKKIFTVQDFKKLGQKVINDIVSRKKIPIVCGGTGFYIDALFGKTSIPEIPPDWKLRKKLEEKSAEELFTILKKLDSRRSKTIDPKNKRRLIRAIEIVKITKKPVPPLSFKTPTKNVLFLGLTYPKETLKKRIERRVEKMLEKGLVKEVKKLRGLGLTWKRIQEFGFEYKLPALYLQKKISKEQMLASLKTENWRYAKRQMTWFKRNPAPDASRRDGADKKIHWLVPNKTEEIQKQAEKLIKRFLE